MSPGESRTVMLTPSVSSFTCVDSLSGDRILWPGTYTIRIGDVIEPAKHTMVVAPRTDVNEASGLGVHAEGGLIVESNVWARGFVKA